MRWNISHLCDIPSWAGMILKEGPFDVAPPGGPPHTTPEIESVNSALESFDQNVVGAIDHLKTFDLDTLEDDWSLLAGGHPILTHPRYMIYRMYMINHVAHHRGHLLVYLRTGGIETPGIYG